MHINTSYKLYTIYGPFAIHSYGLFIALGIIISTYLMGRNKKFIALHLDTKISTIVTVAIIAGIIGGKFIDILSEPMLYQHWTDWFAIWHGGFSALGSIIGVITIVPFYLKIINVPITPLFDITAIYAPLFQSIARLGCLVAGCCHGIPTHSIVGIVYTNQSTIAPWGVTIHPTQFYSSLILFFIFLFMMFFVQHRLKKPGQIFTSYLILTSAERFFLDFWRADRVPFYNSSLSFHQVIAIILFFLASVYFIWLSSCKKRLISQKDS